MRKAQLFIAVMLFMSVVATGFALAEDSAVAVSADSVVSEVNAGVSVDDLATLDEAAADDVPNTWKARPAISAIYGQGWTTGGEFANLVVLSKTFVNSANTGESKTVFRGRMAIGDMKYGLRATSDSADALSGTMTFDVYQNGDKVDSLTLEVSDKYENMAVRTGNFDGSEINIATKTRTMQKPVKSVARTGAVKANSAGSVEAASDSSAEAKTATIQRAGLRGFLDRLFVRKAVRAEVRADATSEIR